MVFDYVNPAGSVAPAGRAAHQALAERVAAVGESIQSYFDTAPLCASMSATGFRHVDDVGPERIAARFFPESERIRRRRAAAISCTPPRSEPRGSRSAGFFAGKNSVRFHPAKRQLTMKSPG